MNTVNTENTELSERESDVLRLVAKGLSNQAIATELFIGAETVKSHLKAIYRKLGVSNRTEAAARAIADAGTDPVAEEILPQLSITEHRAADRVRVDVSGELDMVSAPALESTLLRLLEAQGEVEVDLAEVPFIDSSGLRALVAAAGLGSVVIVGASRQVLRMLQVTGLERTFGLVAHPA